LVVLLGALLAAGSADGSAAAALQKRLQEIAVEKQELYNCSIGIAVETGAGLVLSAGNDGSFAWGSVTKLATGAALMQQVAARRISLDTPVAPLIDPLLVREGLGRMHVLFGPRVDSITLEHLLAMKSGIPDYDTATPYPPPPTDAFRKAVYAQPAAEWPPAKLLNLSYVRKGKLEFEPGAHWAYSSTNFVLAGLLLARLSNATTWDAYGQAALLSPLPAQRRSSYALDFASHGTPAAHGAVRGFDRTSYNGANASARPGVDVSDVAGVFGGWTASDIVAPPASVARLVYDLFGASGPRLLARQYVDEMIPGARDAAGGGQSNWARGAPLGGGRVASAASRRLEGARGRFGARSDVYSHRMEDIYGLATFNLSIMGVTGQSSLSPYAVSYGHLGATYGYDSIAAYFPAIDAAVSIGTSIETDSQTAPSDTLCLVYNALLAAVRGTAEPRCSFSKESYFGGRCDCGNTYACHKLLRKCVKSELGSLSKEDCSRTC